MIGAGLIVGAIVSVVCLRIWFKGEEDPALGGNPEVEASRGIGRHRSGAREEGIVPVWAGRREDRGLSASE